jgi:hypothetical protein
MPVSARATSLSLLALAVLLQCNDVHTKRDKEGQDRHVLQLRQMLLGGPVNWTVLRRLSGLSLFIGLALPLSYSLSHF